MVNHGDQPVQRDHRLRGGSGSSLLSSCSLSGRLLGSSLLSGSSLLQRALLSCHPFGGFGLGLRLFLGSCGLLRCLLNSCGLLRCLFGSSLFGGGFLSGRLLVLVRERVLDGVEKIHVGPSQSGGAPFPPGALLAYRFSTG